MPLQLRDVGNVKDDGKDKVGKSKDKDPREKDSEVERNHKAARYDSFRSSIQDRANRVKQVG